MFITIKSWAKYNPRSDVKHTTWFRLENNFWSDPVIFRLDPAQKLVWIALLAVASQQMSGTFDVNSRQLSVNLGIDIATIGKTIRALEAAGKITKSKHKAAPEDVTPTSRARDATNETGVTRVTRVTKQGGGKNKLRCIAWDPSHRYARPFEHLLAIGAYAEVFDVPHDEKILDDHCKRHQLTADDMENVTWNFRNWADGPVGEKIRSPRGVLATFVKNYAMEPPSARKGPAKKQPTIDDLYPLITRQEDCY